jgi:hypothetical protein
VAAEGLSGPAGESGQAVPYLARRGGAISWSLGEELADECVELGWHVGADAAALQALERWDDERRYAAFHRPDMPDAVDEVVDEASGANVIAVRTGGDGVFTTLVGYAADGAITSFATILMTLPADPTDTAPLV